MLLGGLFQAWRSVCRGGASDLLTGERIACFSGVCPRVPLVTRCVCRTKSEYCAGQRTAASSKLCVTNSKVSGGLSSVQ